LPGKIARPIKGKANKKQALKQFHELMAATAELPESPNVRIVDLCEAFLDFSSRNHAPDTYRNHRFYIQSFCESAGQTELLKLKPFHVTRWIESKKWNETSRYNGRRFVFRVLSWSEGEGLISHNPLKRMKRPKPKLRRRSLTDEEYTVLFRATDSCFRRFLFALRQSGARPKEIRELTWNSVQSDRWVLWEHKTDGSTSKPRVIYLTKPMQKLMRFLRKHSTSEHVFSNSRGKPWTCNAVRLRISRLKTKLNLADDVCAYLFRHAFGTNAIINGVDTSTVAELMGHSSTEMVNTVYVHLADETTHLQKAVEKATRRK
jgi:integrase